MRIVIVGAYGLLGGYVTARLLRDGHAVIGVGRDLRAAQRRVSAVEWRRAELGATTVSEWTELLAGADAVVNCAGALQDSPRDNLRAVHVTAVAALAEACLQAGVRRLIHISAVGVERGQDAFARTKRDAETMLRQGALDWVILRPALVLAPSAYGGSALLRGLAAFPWAIPAVAAEAAVQTVWADDVAEAVARCLSPGAPSRFACDLAAPEATRLRDILGALRAWLGLDPAPVVALPAWCAWLSARVADGLAVLGWRSPMRTAALRRLYMGVYGRSDDAARHLGFTPRPLALALSQSPAGVQERWYARLYFAKPLAILSLAVFWGASGWIGFLKLNMAASVLTTAGVDGALAKGLVTVGSLVDLALAGLVCVRGAATFALRGMVLTTLAYLIGGTYWASQLWGDPLGPLLKSVPAAMLALVALGMMDER